MDIRNYSINSQKTRKKLRIFVRDNFHCTYCNKMFNNLNKLTIDHVLPKALGGTNNSDNLTTSCKCCNHKKNDKLLTEFIKDENLKLTFKLASYL